MFRTLFGLPFWWDMSDDLGLLNLPSLPSLLLVLLVYSVSEFDAFSWNGLGEKKKERGQIASNCNSLKTISEVSVQKETDYLKKHVSNSFFLHLATMIWIHVRISYEYNCDYVMLSWIWLSCTLPQNAWSYSWILFLSGMVQSAKLS